ncbi:hypothetical protein BH09DEP1_BH09DEP1_1960 [soil metagenome]
MNKNMHQPGYILAITLAFISMLMFLGAYVANKGLVFGAYSKVMINREKAMQLAQGGIQLALSQIAGEPIKKDQAKKEPAKDTSAGKPAEPQASEGKQILKQLLPVLNKVQNFTLKQSIEGVSGTITLLIGSEEGKININALYDFDKHKFVGEGNPQNDMKKVAQEIFAAIKERTGADLFAEFEKFLKDRKYPINDVTELLAIKGFEAFKNEVFEDPGTAKADKKPKIYLADLFTVSTNKPQIEPWLLSDSVLALLNLKRDKEKSGDDLLKNYKDRSDWKNDWAKALKPLYNIDYTALPKGFAALLNPTFAPRMFSVLSIGTVSGVSVRLLAIVERAKSDTEGAAKMIIRKVTVI